jgi:hypothetical protein
MALDFIIWRLGSLKTTIQVDQFFPRAYFSQRFSVEHTFDPENAGTYTTLKDFIKKYGSNSLEERSWGGHTAFEVETFQTYDAPDFRKYLNLKLGGHEEEESVENSYLTGKTSSESTLPTSAGTITPVHGVAKVHLSAAGNGMNGSSSSGSRRNPNFNSSPSPECQNSLKSKSRKSKSKFKGVFMLGLKKGNNALQLKMKDTSGRTNALLEKHNRAIRTE